VEVRDVRGQARDERGVLAQQAEGGAARGSHRGRACRVIDEGARILLQAFNQIRAADDGRAGGAQGLAEGHDEQWHLLLREAEIGR
jgi:hypothetical protein